MSRENPYVLVVDDSADGREMLTEYLLFRGFEVVAVANGEHALAQVQRRQPAVILMDLQMPGVTGWEATRQLKAHPDTEHIIIIALSAHAMSRDEGIARQAGCDGFIPKPYDIKSVGDAVGELIARGRAGLTAIEALTQLPGGRKPKPRSSQT